jgi:hypothetical protein
MKDVLAKGLVGKEKFMLFAIVEETNRAVFGQISPKTC